MPKALSQVRIIGGKFRGRKIPFAPVPGLRPTTDRIRETLFNWLRNDIVDAVCLDAFAGSGALGFEAVSRGAGNVVMIEQSREVVTHLRHVLQQLAIDNVQLVHADTLKYLAETTQQFDIIFLDPPFHDNKLLPLLKLIAQGSLLPPHALIYIETANPLVTSEVPSEWECLKAQQAGQVHYALYRSSPPLSKEVKS